MRDVLLYYLHLEVDFVIVTKEKAEAEVEEKEEGKKRKERRREENVLGKMGCVGVKRNVGKKKEKKKI
jgi:hypothetical protein